MVGRLHTVVGSIRRKNDASWRWDSDGQRRWISNENGGRQMKKDSGWL